MGKRPFQTALLETERLLLRKIRRADREDVFDYSSRPAVARYVLWRAHGSLLDTDAFIEDAIRCYERNQPSSWAVVHKTDQKVIGTASAFNHKPTQYCAEIGYVLSPDYQGRGYMTEAVGRMLEHLYIAQELNRVEARTFIANAASARLLNRFGFVREGVLRECAFKDGQFYDACVYSLLKREWIARRDATPVPAPTE